LQKVLARAGFGSRRACEELIERGRVRVNGVPAALGSRVDAARDVVELDGVRVQVADDFVYIALHKPAGVVTTARDPQGRPTVLDLVPRHPRVFPVGRLDRDTSGLLLLTNDGDFALRMTHPRYGVAKTYVAEVEGEAGRKHVAKLRKGVRLEDGVAHADDVRITGTHRGRGIVEIVVREGRKRLVRRLLAAVGLPVVTLTRSALGPLRLGRLKPGAHRELTRAEVLELLRASEEPSARQGTDVAPDSAAHASRSSPGPAKRGKRAKRGKSPNSPKSAAPSSN
jgi:23S rRNA pseudouridine2605 synthase